MRHIGLLVLVLGCPRGAPSVPTQPPERELEVAAACRGYCETLRRCAPDFDYMGCASDCTVVLASSEQSAVSGLTPALVRCWAEAATCDLAVACDAAEGERK